MINWTLKHFFGSFIDISNCSLRIYRVGIVGTRLNPNEVVQPKPQQQVAQVWSLERQPAQAGFARERFSQKDSVADWWGAGARWWI